MTRQGTSATFWSRPRTGLGTRAGFNTERGKDPISFRSGPIPAVGDPTHARPRPAAGVAPRAREQRPPIGAGVAALSGPCGGAVGAMSRHRRVARRQPGGAAGGSAAAAAVRARAEALRELGVDEEVEMAVQLALERFRSGDEAEMEFPSSFTSTERAFVHRLCQSLGLVSKSKGKGANRYLTVRKKDVSELTHAVMACDLALRTKHAVRSLIQSFPVTNKERTELLPRTERGSARAVESENKELNKTSGRLNDGIPQVPVKRGESEFDSFRQSLPVLEKQEEIVQTIKDNKIVLIIGETGSGKTTQIPQFILDDCYKNGAPCRVFCTQPRRLAAVAVAERVAAERREKIGQTIGYQLRLESSSASFEVLVFLFAHRISAGEGLGFFQQS
ncbi:3'-5' RNA helicase YTHDC2-like isoform X4 [Corvus cornix cornix]|uniref:3'-5' RNA helicase YTHDC2-like isoform X4 n=1 Tax=Corvus cornix cornix TaxID=932674 RepID=UPI00194E57A5|nr:3'-5' RNA helicase YTHDC2-like isoform X4 [Corvus cornix cornix]